LEYLFVKNLLLELLKLLSLRNWETKFTHNDVKEILKCEEPTCGLVVSLGVEKGYFELQFQDYVITKNGKSVGAQMSMCMTPLPTCKSDVSVEKDSKDFLGPTLKATAFSISSVLNNDLKDQIDLRDLGISTITSNTVSRARARVNVNNLKIAKKEEEVKSILSGETASGDDETAKCWLMAKVYEQQLREYRNKPYMVFFKKSELSRQTKTVLKRACAFADELGVDFTTYVRAQFWWFDTNFSQAPELHYLASSRSKFNAKERVKVFLQEASTTQLMKPVRSREMVPPKWNNSAKFDQCDVVLKRMMTNYKLTEEEVFKAFKGHSIDLFFDSAWLKQNETYKRLRAAGEV